MLAGCRNHEITNRPRPATHSVLSWCGSCDSLSADNIVIHRTVAAMHCEIAPDTHSDAHPLLHSSHFDSDPDTQ